MRHSATAFVFIILFISTIATAQDVEPAANAFSFTDISKEAGVRINPHVGGHGVVFGDVNNDGFVDFYITNALSVPDNIPNYLFINNGDGTFSQESGRRGVQDAEIGHDEYLGSHGAVFADLDKDGFFDLFLGNAGFHEKGQSRVFINKGTGYFADRTEDVGLYDKRYDSRGVAVADFNGDGILDLVQTNTYPDDWVQIKPPNTFQTERVFWGQADGTYEADDSTGMEEFGFSQGIIAVDIDGDGDMDIIESGWPEKKYDDRSNLLWLNNGNGKFTDASFKVGETFAREPGGIRCNGAIAADMDNDGDMDIIVVGGTLRYYRNDGGMNFTELTDTCGIFVEQETFTIVVGDVDNDGDLDAFIPDQAEEFRIFENLGDNMFKERPKTGIKAPKRVNDVPPDSRGAAFADIDNDGDLDLVVANKANYVQVFRNNLKSKDFLRFELIGAHGDRGAIGTEIFVYPKGMLKKKSSLLVYREATGSTAYLAQNDPTIHIGLPRGNKRVDVIVKFPSGEKVKMRNIRRGKTFLVDASQIKNSMRVDPVISLLSDAEQPEQD